MIIAHTIIFCVALLYGIVAGVVFAIDATDALPAWISVIVSMGLTLGLGAFFVVGGVCLNYAEPVIDEEPYEVEYIVALNDNNLIAGRSYVRRGHVDESLHYQYMVQLEDGSLKAAEVPADNTTLFYATENYRVEKYHETKKWLYFETQSTQIKIYIPKDTVLEQFGVQLE